MSSGFHIDVSEITNMIYAKEFMEIALEVIDETADDIYIDLVSPPSTGVGTPVDTGEARLSWSVDKSIPLQPEISTTSAYMNRLNEGSSTQAPAGFVEAAVAKNAD